MTDTAPTAAAATLEDRVAELEARTGELERILNGILENLARRTFPGIPV